MNIEKILKECVGCNNDEPMDGDEVDILIERLRNRINLHQGNITENEFTELENGNSDTNSGECPVCKNEDLNYGSSFADGDCYIYKWDCDSCGTSGREIYDLVFVCQETD